MLQQLFFKLSNGHFAGDGDHATSGRSPSVVDNSSRSAQSRALNICFVLPPAECYYSRSGGAISTVTRQLTRSLIERGHSVEVITPDDGEQHYPEGEVHRLRYGPAVAPSDLIHKLNVAEARARGWSWPDYGPYLRQTLRSLSKLSVVPDLVIVANDPELAHRLHRKGIGHRQVLWLHNQMEGKEARRLHHLASDILLVAVSDSVRGWTSSTYGIPADSITVIHNGIDLEEFHPRDGFINSRGSVRVVCHGRIDPNKGHDIAAKAVGALRRQGFAVTFTMMGGVQTFGIPESEAQAYADALNRAVIDAEGTALGRIPSVEVAGSLRDHDIACVLSKSAEPFPLAALEAMASGCAVITTAKGGIKEMVGDSGVFVEVDDVDGVAAAIAELSTDPRLLSERKVSARTRSELFTWDKAAVKVESLMADSRRR